MRICVGGELFLLRRVSGTLIVQQDGEWKIGNGKAAQNVRTRDVDQHTQCAHPHFQRSTMLKGKN